MFTIRLANASGTVSWETADGPAPNAEAGKDYTAVDGSHTFSSGDEHQVRVDTLTDTITESTEKFTLSVEGPNGLTASGVGNITDVEETTTTTTTTPPPGLSVSSTTVREGDDAEFVIRLTGGTTARNVSWATRPGSASESGSDRDYSPPGTDTILSQSMTPGGPSWTVSVETLADTKDEGSETFYVIASAGSLTATGTGTITDEPAGDEEPGLTAQEGGWWNTQVCDAGVINVVKGHAVEIELPVYGPPLTASEELRYLIVSVRVSGADTRLPGELAASAVCTIEDDDTSGLSVSDASAKAGRWSSV